VWCSVWANAQNVSVNFQDTLLCVDGSFKLPYTVTAPVFVAGNIFTAQLSDASGGFASPVSIGTKTSTVSDTIICTIPSGTIPGTAYRIRISSSNPAQLSADNGKNLYISNYPEPIGQISTPLCQGDTLVLTTTSITPIDSYVWYGPNLSGILGNPVKKFGVIVNDSGNYIVRAYYRGCQANDTVHLVVKPNPANIFSAVNTSLCEDDTLWLKANSATATSYQWTGPNLFFATAKDTFIANTVITNSGKYFIRAFLDGCKIKDSIVVNVKPRPRPHISFNTPVCEKQTVTIQSSVTISGEHYQWSGPNGISDTTRTITIPNVPFSASGKYIITVSNNGCTGKDSADIIVKPLPVKPVPTANTPVCAEDTLLLSCNDTVQGQLYSWTGPKNYAGVNAHVAIPDIDTSRKGMYYVTADLNGCKQIDSIDVMIKPRPIQPIITSNSPVKPGEILYLNLKNHYPGWGYKWTGPKGFFSQAIRPAILNVDTGHSGTYSVTVTYDGCTNSNQTLVQVDYKTDTGIFILLPNPNDGGFVVHALLKADQNVPMQIVNAMGQEVYTNSIPTRNKSFTAVIDLRNRLASGIYMLTLIADDDKHTFKFEVRR
jgi:hypothetical protein